jgi:hypothetical protein
MTLQFLQRFLAARMQARARRKTHRIAMPCLRARASLPATGRKLDVDGCSGVSRCRCLVRIIERRWTRFPKAVDDGNDPPNLSILLELDEVVAVNSPSLRNTRAGNSAKGRVRFVDLHVNVSVAGRSATGPEFRPSSWGYPQMQHAAPLWTCHFASVAREKPVRISPRESISRPS